MNILIVITCLHPHGAEYSCLRHIKEYQKKYNFKFTLLTILDGELKKEFKEIGIPIIILKKEFKISKLNYLFKIIFQNKYDLIHSWMYHANILGLAIGLFTRTNVITSIRQALPNYKALKPQTILIAFIDSILSRFIAKKIVFNSKVSINDHCKRLFYTKKKSIYIPNKPYIVPFSVKNYFNEEKKETLHFISLARDDKSKNLKYMIKLFNSLKDKRYNFILDIYGDNIERSSIKDFHKKMMPKNTIRFFPKINDLEKILFKYDFYISTSLWEGYPNSLITAASSGCIPIATNAGDSWDLLGKNVFKLLSNINYDLKIISEAVKHHKNNIRSKRSIDCINFLDNNYKSYPNYLDIYLQKW